MNDISLTDSKGNIQNTTYRFEINEGDNTGRLDKILAALCDDFSRARLQALIEEGHVFLNGNTCLQSSAKVKTGDIITLDVPSPVEAIPEAENIPLHVIYEDEHLIVIDKPAGMVVHPGAGNYEGTLVNALLYHCAGSLSGIGGVMRPGIVHRLDKDTSGLMIAAKTDQAHKGLSEQLQDRSLSRVYKALVLGVPQPPKGFVKQPIGRDHRNRLKMAVNHKYGKEAKTFYHVEENFRGEFSLVECKLESGRTHQIRVHMAFLGHFLVGDPLYGPQPTALKAALKRAEYELENVEYMLNFPRQALHAACIKFVHPVTGEGHSYMAEMSDDICKLLKIL